VAAGTGEAGERQTTGLPTRKVRNVENSCVVLCLSPPLPLRPSSLSPFDFICPAVQAPPPI